MQDAQPTAAAYDAYGGAQPGQPHDYNAGRTRKKYFMGLVVGLQLFLALWLSMHLITTDTVATSAS